MRYWLYQDARILGPFSREDLLAQPGVGPDSLVCAETFSGNAEKDWCALSQMSEAAPQAALAGAAVASAPGRAEEPAGGFQGFQRDAHAALDALGMGGEWDAAMFSMPELSDLWPPVFERPLEESPSVLRDERTAALEDRLVRLKEEFLEAQKREEALAGELARKARELAEKEDALADLRRTLERRRVAQSVLEASAPAPTAAMPPVPEAPPIPAAPPVQAPVFPVLPPIGIRPDAGVSPSPVEGSVPPEVPVARAPAETLSSTGFGIPTVPVTEAALPPVLQPSPGPVVPELPVEAPPLAGPENAHGAAGMDAPTVPALDAVPSPVPTLVDGPAVPELPSAPPLEAAGGGDAPPSPTFSGVPPLDAAGGLETEAAPPPLEAVPPPPPGLSEGGGLASTLGLPPPIDFNAELAAPSEAPPLEDALPAQTETPFERAKTVIFSSPEAGPEQAVPALQPPQADPTNPFMPVGGTATPIPVPIEGAQPPAFGQPKTMLFGGAQEMALNPPEAGAAPGAEGATSSGEIPLTVRSAVTSGGEQPGLPENLWGPRTPVPTELPGTGGKPIEDLFAHTPAPATLSGTVPPAEKTALPEAKEKKRSPKLFLIGLGIAVVVLVVVAAVFLRNPGELAMMLSMSPQKKTAAEQAPGAPEGAPEGQVSQGGGAPFGTQAPVAGAPPQAAAAPEPPAQTAAPEHVPPAAPPQGRDFIQDDGVQALEFVKSHYLDKERGSIAQWLQYSFMSPGNEDEWVAAAVQSKVYLVTYRVFQGGRTNRSGQAITYLFEADLEKGTLIGRNPAAKDLLGAAAPGSGTAEGAAAAAALEAEHGRPAAARPKPRAAAKAAPKRSVRKAPRKAEAPVRRAEDEQLPLPDESEMEGAQAPAAGGFNNPGADSVDVSP